MSVSNYVEKLGNCRDYSCIFNLVKEVVEKSLGRRRAGLMLGLLDLPPDVGAFFQVGSNFIMMNRGLLNMVKVSKDKALINAYIFHILLHEYIHSLGFLDEGRTQSLTYKISKDFLGEEHLATIMAEKGISSVVPLRGFVNSNKQDIELVKDFETEHMGYIG